MPLVLGIDAGGTSTKSVLVDDDGKEVWAGHGQAVNASTGIVGRIFESLEGCPQPDSACAAVAGLVNDNQRELIEALLRPKFPNATVKAVPDFEAALEACAPAANICVIAGTGSIVCSLFEGEVKRTGGRGYILGDEGSGFQFGRDAFLAFLDASDEGVSETLASAIEAAFGTRLRSDAVAELYSGQIAQRLASLAPALAADAEEDAIYALKSLRVNMAKLAHVCRQHLKRYGPTDPIIGCQGGLWSSPVYRSAFLDAVPLWCELPAESVVFDLPKPVMGAVAIARSLL
ncbi:MAG: BadF/BadG/BcrA/BcrD ATPase family protein [Fimbriimonadales bacterium]